jgi:hypothetical protein
MAALENSEVKGQLFRSFIANHSDIESFNLNAYLPNAIEMKRGIKTETIVRRDLHE